MTPFFHSLLHIGRQGRLEKQLLPGVGMNKPERLGVQSLSRQDFVTILDKLPVFIKSGTF
jgi:hypothetical protein